MTGGRAHEVLAAAAVLLGVPVVLVCSAPPRAVSAADAGSAAASPVLINSARAARSAARRRTACKFWMRPALLDIVHFGDIPAREFEHGALACFAAIRLRQNLRAGRLRALESLRQIVDGIAGRFTSERERQLAVRD